MLVCLACNIAYALSRVAKRVISVLNCNYTTYFKQFYFVSDLFYLKNTMTSTYTSRRNMKKQGTSLTISRRNTTKSRYVFECFNTVCIFNYEKEALLATCEYAGILFFIALNAYHCFFVYRWKEMG